MFTDPKKVADFLNKPTKRKLSKDPIYILVRAFLDYYYGNIASPLKENSRQLKMLQRTWMKTLSEMNPELNNYPDANGTLRVSWGKVREYRNFEGHNLPVQTTLSGLIKKSDSGRPDYEAPEKLIDLYRSKHYGKYGRDGRMPLGFITDTDISSGNSGSPVLNQNGALIGLVFDGNKESLTGDLSYHPDSQRSINLDIRFVLFMVDHFANANHLIKEMNIVEPPKPSEPKIHINVPSQK